MEIIAVLLTSSKYFNVSMNSDICESIVFKLGMMIDATHIFILVYVTLTFMQGHGDARKQKLVRQLSHRKFSMGLERIWHAVETCLSYESHVQFFSSDQYSREKILLFCFFFFSFVRWKLQSPWWRWQYVLGPPGYNRAWGLQECGLARFPFWAACRGGRSAADVLLSDCQYCKGTVLYGRCRV